MNHTPNDTASHSGRNQSSGTLCKNLKSGIFSVKQLTDIGRYFSEQVGADLPVEITEELSALRQRLFNV
jgi:hypothetical protein